MRVENFAWAASVLCMAAALPGQAPQPGQLNIKTERKDLGEAFGKWIGSDEKKPSVATSTPNTSAPSGSSFGSSVGSFFSNLMPSGKSETPAGSGPVRLTIEGTARANDANV